MEKVTPPMEKVTDGKGQTRPMEKVTDGKGHRWKRSDPTDGKGHRSRAVASARLIPCRILPGMMLVAARFILLSKSVRFL
jgi:hypothetical protein